ncbi:MAG: hypothetical protein JWO40_244 [Candidatus Doudnabacteria bacterium]|nr:hypothetical protein [Candidatus Doudnabacteria bacterium]
MTLADAAWLVSAGAVSVGGSVFVGWATVSCPILGLFVPRGRLSYCREKQAHKFPQHESAMDNKPEALVCVKDEQASAVRDKVRQDRARLLAGMFSEAQRLVRDQQTNRASCLLGVMHQIAQELAAILNTEVFSPQNTHRARLFVICGRYYYVYDKMDSPWQQDRTVGEEDLEHKGYLVATFMGNHNEVVSLIGIATRELKITQVYVYHSSPR